MADVVVRGVRFHYQRLGHPHADRAVVFLHGLVMDNLASWYFTVAAAVARHADVLVYDLRGHGRTERPKSGYSLDDMVEDLRGLLDATLGDKPVCLVGNSFGGLLGLAFAQACPERVSGLVLVDGHLGDEAFGAEMASTLSLRGAARDEAIATVFKDWLGRHSERKRNRLAENADALVEGTTLVEDLRRTKAVTVDSLAALEVPVLALYGERSDLRARAERLLARVPRCTFRVLPGCTHSILWEATDAVRDLVVDFCLSGLAVPKRSGEPALEGVRP